MKKTILLSILPLFFVTIMLSCSSDDDNQTEEQVDDTNDPVVEAQTVFEKLEGKTFKQIESASDCFTCQDEINYYIFSPDQLQITGTTYDEICEQNDIQPIGSCQDCATIVEDTEDLVTICLDDNCQTITFLSDDEIEFDFPAANIKWRAQLFEDEAPCKEWEPIGGDNSVLARLTGNTYQQIESTSSCANCEDEINYYMFLEEGMRITGTTYDEICEQNDFFPYSDLQTEINTTDLLRVCTGSIFKLCWEVTFLSESEIQMAFSSIVGTTIWTSQLYTEEVPCTQWGFNAFFTSPFGGAILSDESYDPFTATFEWPSSAEEWAGFANSNESIYPLTFPNGGNITFTAATSGTEIDVYLRLERLPYLDSDPGRVEPSYNTSPITISGTDTKQYTLEIPSQGANTYSSMIFYLMTRDQELTVSSDFVISTY